MDWKDWETKYRITYSAASDESIDSMSQKIIAEFDRIYELLARLRKFDASTGTDVIDSVPYQLKVNTTTEEILIRNTANDSWYKIGKLADYFGITPKLIGAVKNKGNIENLQMGNEADKPLAENGIANDVYIACDTKKVFRHTGTAWELLLSLNFEELLGNTAVTTNDVVTLPTANKLLKMNSEGKLPTDITGSPQKIAGKPIDPTQLADGRTLVYRETSGNFEFEAKAVVLLEKAK
jgi:hypothetical protein